jgi:hypothetical protein
MPAASLDVTYDRFARVARLCGAQARCERAAEYPQLGWRWPENASRLSRGINNVGRSSRSARPRIVG